MVYNMIRLADYLFRWTGTPDMPTTEQNLHNGLLAQAFWQSGTRDTFCEPLEPETGIVSPLSALAPGSQKKWGSKTGDFWCCHCTAVQANANYREFIYYGVGGLLTVAQYIPPPTWKPFWAGSRWPCASGQQT